MERERATDRGDWEREAKVWAEKISECTRLRRAY